MDEYNSADHNQDETSVSLVKKIFRAPANQSERIASATLGVVSLAASAGIYLLRGISSLTLPGLLISAGLGVAAWWTARKYPRQKPAAYVIGGVAAVTLVNAIPAISGLGGFVLGLSGFAALAFGLWKVGSTIFSIFRGDRSPK
jgi:hypothetical protein